MTVTEEERLARAALTYVAEPADKAMGRMIRQYGAEHVLSLIRSGEPPDDVTAQDRVTLRQRFVRWQARLPSAEELGDETAWAEGGIRLLCPGDLEWPSQLDDLGLERPRALWVLGDPNLRFGCLKSVAMVGSRSASGYGVHVATTMAAELADRSWTVVSGGALGVDGAAHRGTLAADGLTIAVFACGVDVRYPRSNSGLFTEMGRCGLLVSEVPPGVAPTRQRFLVRNRVIAALTRGTVVVEAALRSGSISTAGYARALGRAVMVVPGPVTSALSAGCHELLRDWPEAVCVTDAAEVLDRVGLIGDDLAPLRRGPSRERDRLGSAARDVLDALPARGTVVAAKIAVTAGLDLDTTLSCLGELAAGGFVERAETGWRLRPRAKR